SAALAVLIVFMLADAFFRFPQPVLPGMFVVWAAFVLFLIVWVFRRLGRSHRSLEATARRIEAELPELRSNLINLIQLIDDTRNENRAFCLAAVNHAAGQIGHIRLEEAAKRETRWGRFVYCMQTAQDLVEWTGVLLALIGITVACNVLIPGWGSAGSRLLQPWHFVPAQGEVRIVDVKPGNAEVLVGSSVTVEARIENPDKKAYEGFLFIRRDEEPEERLPMAVDETSTVYTFTVPAVTEPMEYRVEIGDSQSEIYRLTVCEKPTVADLEVTYRYPTYLKRPADTFRQQTADLEAPQYTEATLRIRPSTPIARGYVDAERGKIVGEVRENGNLFLVDIPMINDGTFTIHLETASGYSDPTPRVNRITVVPDHPPAVELLKPGRTSTAAPGDALPVKIRGRDDYGISRIRLEMLVKEASVEGSAPTVTPDDIPSTVHVWTEFEGTTTVLADYTLELDPEKFEPGQIVMLRAVAWDTRDVGSWGLDLRPQETTGPWHTISLISRETRDAEKLASIESLRTAIFRILEQQIRARATTGRLVGTDAGVDLTAGLALSNEIRTRQIDIQKQTSDLVATIKDTDSEERRTIRRILNTLAVGEMLQAVDLADRLTKTKDASRLRPQAEELSQTQAKIIDILRRLLDVARKAQAEMLSEMERRSTGDLPDDVRNKLEEIHAKMQEFLEQQKKIIEASEELAKTPVEDFTEKEEQLLKTLAAQEDDWSRFMQEAHSDLSKLPEQDFSNSTLCKELNEIQTELKMAEDALLKKSADIAVPLEQLGAEMAEEITTNLEKWLPDTPDRERWSQEEALNDEGKEAPMAELPGELEDLIGELLEEEEDLFDEMEDVSSSAADSLDKGAGWDVADGPISNMSAKGATGNRLPNSSEIGGRAGEGRSGKSSGEFVSEEAVGKGGRKTPSRLTADPYMEGQVKDHSKDPTGGATGGGKESGQGGEGLEGPAPRSPGPRELQRLAGKQAALRNKAEGIDAQMQIMNYHHTDMEQLIDLMAEIERDLQAGRYQNALRKREIVLQSLESQKQYVAGEFEVKRDTTANLPADIQKDILGAVQDPAPPGWEELVRGYYRRLSGTDASTSQSAPETAAPVAE
ncbi:MAG: hypothetical protein D6741_02220, partial [Planctomycetota bacterium]